MFDKRTNLRQRDGRHVGHKKDAMRIADIGRDRRPDKPGDVGQCRIEMQIPAIHLAGQRDLLPSKSGNPHIDRDPLRARPIADKPTRIGLNRDLRIAGFRHQQPTNAAGRIATGIHLAPIGVINSHEGRAVRIPRGLDPDQLIETDAKPPIRHRAQQGGIKRYRARARVNDHKVIAKTVHLYELDFFHRRVIGRSPRSCQPQPGISRGYDVKNSTKCWTGAAQVNIFALIYKKCCVHCACSLPRQVVRTVSGTGLERQEAPRMKRFIDHEELARDSRFIRQDGAANSVLASLPDDVDTVVDIFEQLAPMIEKATRGTAAEPLYEEYGPAYNLVVLNEPIHPDDPALVNRLRFRLHGILIGELQALEGASRSLWDFPEAPWEFKMNMARQAWDEARHVQIYEKLLQYMGGEIGDYPENTFLFECACSEDPAMRVAGVNRGLEGLACDVFRDLIRYAEKVGDDTIKQAVDFVLADEITHVRFGSNWVKEFTKDDPDYFKRTQEFRREVDKRFSFGGARSAREDAAIPLAVQDRLEAGFTAEEIDEIGALSVGGPSRETLREAARILAERHRAKKAQQKQTAAE